MAWERGKNVLLYVDTGSTYEALTGEITSRLEKRAPTIAAANKSTSGHKGADYGDGRETRITGSGHLDDTTLDAALDALEDNHDAQTKVSVRYVVPNPWNSYIGNVVVEEFNISGDNADFAQVDFVLVFDGAPTKSATA